MKEGMDDFLQTIRSRAKACAGILGTDGPIGLHGQFWSYAEIEAGMRLRRDWGIDEDLIPFFGDGHQVMCLSISTGEVFYLDDDRSIISTWPDTKTFLAALTDDAPRAPAGDARLVRMELSPDLKARIQDLLHGKKS